jgi:hypothetical protein
LPCADLSPWATAPPSPPLSSCTGASCKESLHHRIIEPFSIAEGPDGELAHGPHSCGFLWQISISSSHSCLLSRETTRRALVLTEKPSSTDATSGVKLRLTVLVLPLPCRNAAEFFSATETASAAGEHDHGAIFPPSSVPGTSSERSLYPT